jgi:hypothetical protein
MNVAEGTRRMRHAGKWMTVIPLSRFALFVCWSTFVSGFGSLSLVPMLLPAAGPVKALWLSGWIVDGFSRKDP